LAPEPKPKAATASAALLPDPSRRALFLDVDGTLIDIAATPEAVHVPPELPVLLARLRTGLQGALAIVSGRTIADIDKLLSPYKSVAAGLHGLEMRSPASDIIEHALLPDIQELREPAFWLAQSLPGTLLEDKGATLAFHYRLAPQHGPALHEGAMSLIAKRPDLHLLGGKMVMEIKPRNVTKGDAVRRLMAQPPFAGRRPIFVGDDVTDCDGFKAVQALDGSAVVVGPAVLVKPDLSLPNPAAVRAWLNGLAAGIEAAA
jgi:trehalose 6-phosphate phosphatase